MWKEKLNRLALAHRDDDREEAVRFRSVPDQERAAMLASLCRLAAATLGDAPPAQEPRSPLAQKWWEELVRRERAKLRVGRA